MNFLRHDNLLVGIIIQSSGFQNSKCLVNYQDKIIRWRIFYLFGAQIVNECSQRDEKEILPRRFER